MDPGLAYITCSWQLLYATCAKLVNYPDKAGPAGSQLEPEVAQSLPKRSADGKTYTFTIRKGFRFSPPSNEPVTAQTFKYSIERSLSPKLKGPALSNGFLDDVVGAPGLHGGKAPHISGVVARGNTLTIRLTSPVPDLVTRLTMPFFCAVPIGTPLDPQGVRTIPMAGPYFIASYTPGQEVVLKRNPNYAGNRPHRLDRVELTFGVAKRKIDAQIEAGTADYAIDGVDPADAAKLAARYGPGSAAAKSGRQRYFVDPLLGFDFLTLNTHRPLFSDLRLRQAVNYAIDRRALAAPRQRVLVRAAALRPVPPAGSSRLQSRRQLPGHPVCRQGAPAGGREAKNRGVLHLQPVALRPDGPDRAEQSCGDRDRRAR